MSSSREAALYQIEHLTAFEYEEPVRETFMTVFLKPKSSPTQQLETFSITTDPGAELSSYEDSFGNTAHFFDVPGQHDRLTVRAESVVAVHPAAAQPASDEEAPEPAGQPDWKALEELHTPRLWHYLNGTDLTRPTEALANFLRQENLERSATPLDSIRELARRIPEALTFRRGSTQVDSPIDDALAAKSGVCQDFAHLMLAIVRGWGIPARYISGYVFPFPGDTGASHAWVECLLPGLGWVEADPTNGGLPDRQHFRVAAGRDYRDVPPTRGHCIGTTGGKDPIVEVRISALDSGYRPEGERPAATDSASAAR